MAKYRRTNTCGSLRAADIGKQVTLSGWVHRQRDHGGLIFIDLRDRFGITQIVFDPEKDPENHKIGEKLRSEWVISVQGTVFSRQTGMENKKLPTGEIEVFVKSVEVLSKAKTPPFSISDPIHVNEELRLQYRYLDMRRGPILDHLVVRHQVMLKTRSYLDKKGFIEVSTPILGKSTPEGARDYLVPSRVHPGKFYALPQSPQIFKQLLMVGGADRYFQIAPCFRDEDLRADRQPEFTQIDLEMSFGVPQDIMDIIEGLVQEVFKGVKGISLTLPFLRMTHRECLEKYGSDRPDLRFGMELHCLDEIAKQSEFSVFQEQLKEGGSVKGFCVKGGADLSRRMIDEYTAFVSRFEIKGLAWMKRQEGKLTSSIAKFFSEELKERLIEKLNVEEGDLIFMVSDQLSKVNQALDHLRRKLAKDRSLIHPEALSFVWVTDFPLFSWNEEESRLDSEHHPFTSPNFEDLEKMATDPLSVRSSGYDLVLNGYEIGGGSQRIHDSELQKQIFECLQLKPEELESRFGFFLEALSFGTPPHLGIALGLDRLVMLLVGTENIREVIAFPKTQKASDLMMECPSEVGRLQLRDLKLSLEE